MNEFLDAFDAHVAARPGKAAVSDARRSVSYAELDAASDRLAGQMSERGLGPGKLAGYLGVISVDCLTVNLAALKCGVAIVTLDPRQPVAVLEELLDHSDVVEIVSELEYAPLARDLQGAEPLAISRDPADRSSTPVLPRAHCDPEDLYFLSYTSGSTGSPKAVPFTRRIGGARLVQMRRSTPMGPDDICALFNPLWWPQQLVPLSFGAKAECFNFSARGPAELADWLRDTNVTVISAYAALFRQLAPAISEPLETVRYLAMGGEGIRGEDVAAFNRAFPADCRLILRYAAREFGTLIEHVIDHGDRFDVDRVPLGRACLEDTVRILDDSGNDVPDLTPGEITVYGDVVPAAYHRDPETSARVFSVAPDGRRCYATGDLAWRDTDGLLYSLGRKDRQVKIRRYNVRPNEVEGMVRLHPDVAQAAVSAFEGPRGIRRLACYIVASPGARPDGAAIRAFLSARAPNYMVPGVIKLLDDLPKTEAGKIRYAALPDPTKLVEATRRHGSARGTATERSIAAVWRDVLGHDDFDVDSDFFDAGGDSLQAMVMLTAAEGELGVRVPLEALSLESASIHSIAERVDEIRASRVTGGPVVLRQGTDGPPVYAIHVQGGHLSDYLAMLNASDSRSTFYGLHPRGLDGREPPDDTIQAMGRYYASLIGAHQAGGTPTILGYSFGAIVAFETARALTASENMEPDLILIDPLVHLNLCYRWARRIYRYFRDDKYSLLLRRDRRFASFPATSGPAPRQLDAAHARASFHYRPEPLRLARALLVSSTENSSQDRIRAQWRRLIGPDLEIFEQPGDHISMMRDPYASRLALKVRTWIERRGDDDEQRNVDMTG